MSLQTAYLNARNQDLKPKVDPDNVPLMARASLIENNPVTRQIVEELLRRKTNLLELAMGSALQIDSDLNLKTIKLYLQEVAIINKVLTLIYTETYGK